MQIAPVPIASQDANVIVSPKNLIALQLGEIVQAEVLTVTDTMVAVRMKSTILEARTDLPLTEGQVLSLQVEEAGPEIRLRLLQHDEQSAGAVRSTIMNALAALKDLKPAAGDLQVIARFLETASQGLKQTLPELNVLERMLPALENLSGPALKKAVQESGVFFEAKLRLLVMNESDGAAAAKPTETSLTDMKAALLQLKESLGTAGMLERLIQSGMRPERLTAAVDNVLKNTELFQLQSQLSDTLQVFVPFVWQDLREGELVFREAERGLPGEHACSCTINLDLDRVGKVSARVLLQGGLVYVDMLAENDVFSRMLEDNSALLKARFDTAGLRIGGFTFRRESSIESGPGQAGGLNLRV
ncbi:MAG TPA: flagellar hook-length control protein FliK [Nitrospirota bacterium]|nr:flagellar hook-length control protein FliK [Nitrospirota bacterium]